MVTPSSICGKCIINYITRAIIIICVTVLCDEFWLPIHVLILGISHLLKAYSISIYIRVPLHFGNYVTHFKSCKKVKSMYTQYHWLRGLPSCMIGGTLANCQEHWAVEVPNRSVHTQIYQLSQQLRLKSGDETGLAY